MKWKTFNVKNNDLRVRPKFAWLPTKMEGSRPYTETIWLTHYWVVEVFDSSEYTWWKLTHFYSKEDALDDAAKRGGFGKMRINDESEETIILRAKSLV